MAIIPENRNPIHPGEMLVEEFLKPLGLSQVDLARHLGIPVQRVNEICVGKRGVSADTAWRLAGALGTSPEFWLNMQGAYDLARSRLDHAVMRIASPASPAKRAKRTP